MDSSIKKHIDDIREGLELAVKKGAFDLVYASNLFMIISSFENDYNLENVTKKQVYDIVLNALREGVRFKAYTLSKSHDLIRSLNNIKNHISYPNRIASNRIFNWRKNRRYNNCGKSNLLK